MSETKDNLEEILKKKREQEEEAEKREAERLRRTGRKEMKP